VQCKIEGERERERERERDEEPAKLFMGKILLNWYQVFKWGQMLLCSITQAVLLPSAGASHQMLSAHQLQFPLMGTAHCAKSGQRGGNEKKTSGVYCNTVVH